MTKCRSDGELRAYLDRELPPAEMQAVAGHVANCAACDRKLGELTRRAEHIAALMSELADGSAFAPATLRRPAVRPWRWAAAALALAAGLATLFVALPKREGQVGNLPHAAQPVAQVPELAQTSTPRAGQDAEPAKQVRQKQPEVEYFFALDDDPIELGVIQRVALGPEGVPADVVFSPDGRPRAISLVSYNVAEGDGK
jgi:anti-sigma factor RsiW